MIQAVHKLSYLLQWLCVLVGLWFISAYVYIALKSMNYPFSLEWMEGQSIDVVQRIINGKSVYTEPTIEYVPFIYTPLYYYITAAISFFTGVGFFAGRAVSILSSIWCGYLIYAFIIKEGGSWKAAFTGTGLFFATYKASGRWFDIARVDSLFLLLVLSGAFVFFYYRGYISSILAALLMAAAFFTKQIALIIFIPILTYGVVADWRRTLFSGCLMTAIIVSGVISFDAFSDGWFSYYVFQVPSGHSLWHERIIGFWTKDFLPVEILGFISIATIALGLSHEWKNGLRYGSLAAGLIVASWSGRLHTEAFINVMMPAHAAMAILFGIFIAHFERRNEFKVLVVLCLLALWQMDILRYDPKPLIPSENAVALNSTLLQKLTQIDGNVFMPDIQFMQSYIGKKAYDYGMPARDVLRSDMNMKKDIRINLINQLDDAMGKHKFSAVILGPHVFQTLTRLNKFYHLEGQIRYVYGYTTESQGVRNLNVFYPNTDK